MSTPSRFSRPLAALSLVLLALAAPVRAQTPAPAFELESVLDTFFNPATGMVRFGDYTVAFAPEGPFRAQAAVVDAAGRSLATFPFFPEFRARAAVFGRAQVQGPADFTLPGPGSYRLVFSVAGRPATQLGFEVAAIASGDPYNPGRTFTVTGPWTRYAHVTLRAGRAQEEIPYVTFWVGGADLPAGARQDMFAAALVRNGQVVARSKKAQGHIAGGHFKRAEITLFHPHEDRQAHAARSFTRADWMADGTQELRITRQSDSAVLRTFRFDVKQGKFQPHPRTRLGHAPAVDFIVPRVARKGSNVFEMIEAHWLVAP